MKMSSKVIIVGSAYPLRGGIANFNESLCREMMNTGIDASIVSFSLQYPSIFFPGKSQYETAPPNEAIRNISIVSLINSINPFSWLTAAKYILNQKPDVIVVRYWLPFLAPALGSVLRLVRRKNKAIRIIAITDNVLPHEKRIGDKLLTRYFVNSCDAFVVMSESVKNELMQFTTSPHVRLIHHPVYDIFGEHASQEAGRIKLGLDFNKRYILFFGFIRKYKGLDLLIRALAHPGLRSLDVHLIVAGEFYDDREFYIKLIDECDVKSRTIMFDHYISADQVKYFFAAANLVTQPYRNASQSGITQLAYHFERPVLVTNVGGLSEVIAKDSGYAVDPQPEAIAEKIADYFVHAREKGMTDAIRVHKKKFSWQSMVAGILDLYAELKSHE